MPLKRLVCSHCHHLMHWEPEVLKQDQPGFVLRCRESDCSVAGKIQDYILTNDLLTPGRNPLGQ